MTYLFIKYFDVQVTIKTRSKSHFDGNESRVERCKPDLPAELTLINPISPSGTRFQHAAVTLDRTFQHKVATEDIDSLIVGIVGPDGLFWSKGYGLEKANDTSSTQPPGIHTIYRIASISKLFATMETYILRDRGLLDWY